MKVLKKIHLKSVSEFLSDKDMKLVVGGYNLPEVEILGSGTPCNGVGIVFGSCAGTSAQRGDDCDYIRDGYHYKGRCKGVGDPLNAVYIVDARMVPEGGLICHGGSSGVPCSRSYF